MRIFGAVLRIATVGMAVLLSLSAHAQVASRGVEVADAVDVTATVESIDVAARLVTVSGPWKDRMITVEVAPDVPNLDQIKVGDQVSITHYAAIAAKIAKPGTAQRAGPSPESGNRTVTVVIDAVDPVENRLTFTRDGKMRTVVIEDPEAQAFVKTLKKGDEVELTYTEAFATRLERVN